MRLALTLFLLALPAFADAPRVSTDIAPIHALTSQVMEGVGAPDLIVPPGASPHGHALRPSEAQALERADLVLWVGPELTGWLSGPIETLAPDARVIALLHSPGTQVLDIRQEAGFEAHEHGDEHGDDHKDEHDHGHSHGHDHDHGHGTLDPHAWLNPENGAYWLGIIAEELSAIDPENAAQYAANAAAGRAEIEAATADAQAILAPHQGTPYVVFHDAYQYFEGVFGMPAAGAITTGTDAGPSPARIAEIRDVITQTEAACVFSEAEFNPTLIETVFTEGGAGTAVIDPLGTSLPSGANMYPTLIRTLATDMAECFANAAK